MTNARAGRPPFANRHSPIAIAIGDPSGVGPEIILKALDRRSQGVKDSGNQGFRIIGPRSVFEREQRRLGTKASLDLIDDAVPSPGRFAYGRPQKNCGETARLALELGAYLLKTGQVRALVTAPVSKEAIRGAGFKWPGQTEFLAERLGSNHYAMLAWTPRFKAVMVTIHQPLSYVSRHITPDAVLEKIRLLDAFLRQEAASRKPQTVSHGRPALSPSLPLSLDPSPGICVLAFNPHAYEFSRGEENWIAQAVALARKQGIDAEGPIPADAALAKVGQSSGLSFGLCTLSSPFSGYVAMYHDQAMIPAKLLGRDSGVNVTLGLGRVRTSPLHGVAFDIAGKGIAKPGSMLAAIRLARRLTR
jgi:4-hydroxythreonine-4-phosphate dehydrogenase